MSIAVPSKTELINKTWQTVMDNTGLSNSSESGFAINILKVFCEQLYEFWVQAEELEKQSSLSTSTGSNLDSIGTFFGVTRRTATASTTVGSPYSVLFTNNGATTATIPANTRVWPSGDNTIAYFTNSSLSIPAGQQMYVDVTAASPGELHNVGAGQLNMHSAGGSVTVTNEIPITTGEDVESDANYRVRIQNEIYRKESSNLIAVREALLEVPGIRDVEMLNLARGTGTLDVLIYGYDPIVPDSVIAEAQTVLEDSVAAGISALAKAPVIRYIDVAVQLSIKSSATASSVRTLVSAAVRGYVNNLPIQSSSSDGTLYYSELSARVQESSSDIIDSSVSLTVDDLPALKANQYCSNGERFVLRSLTVA